jgi:hypothetical protein
VNAELVALRAQHMRSAALVVPAGHTVVMSDIAGGAPVA